MSDQNFALSVMLKRWHLGVPAPAWGPSAPRVSVLWSSSVSAGDALIEASIPERIRQPMRELGLAAVLEARQFSRRRGDMAESVKDFMVPVGAKLDLVVHFEGACRYTANYWRSRPDQSWDLDTLEEDRVIVFSSQSYSLRPLSLAGQQGILVVEGNATWTTYPTTLELWARVTVNSAPAEPDIRDDVEVPIKSGGEVPFMLYISLKAK